MTAYPIESEHTNSERRAWAIQQISNWYPPLDPAQRMYCADVLLKYISGELLPELYAPRDEMTPSPAMMEAACLALEAKYASGIAPHVRIDISRTIWQAMMEARKNETLACKPVE
jgi:hypothetical protein